MTLDEIRQIIMNSQPADWHAIHEGPMFLDEFGKTTGPGDHWELHVDYHAIRATYTRDVNLGIAYGLPTNPRTKAEGWRPDWARFADPVVTASLADVLWCGALVDRQAVLNADGRAVLPDPRLYWMDKGSRMRLEEVEIVGNTVTSWQAGLARVVHCFEHPPEAGDEYLRRVGFVVVD